MSLRGMYRFFISARVTVILLCALAVLLLLNVALPQEAVLGKERFAATVAEGTVARFFLVTLGLGRLSTSPVFLGFLGLFFLNLILVLISRVGPTWRRVTLKPRSEKGLQAWARLEEALGGALPDNWSPGQAARTLRGFGYQVRKPGERTLWAVKHRTAPLGFLLFHLSFVLLFAGGASIYYTRFVGSAVLSEGQEFTGQYGTILRQRPIAPPPDLAFLLDSVETVFDRGEPVHLGAKFRFRQAGATVVREARVNHPAEWGPTSILVNRSGLAAVLWLQDERGFTVDRIVVPARTRSGPPTDVLLGDSRTAVFIHPLEPTTEFPNRDELPVTPMRFQVTRDSRVVFDGLMRAGDSAAFEGGRLVLEEIRYWAGMTIISERGGGLLTVGFALGIVGLVWRLLWYRREVALTWDDRRFQLVGRSEYFSGRFQEELGSMRDMLERGLETSGEAGRNAEA